MNFKQMREEQEQEKEKLQQRQLTAKEKLQVLTQLSRTEYENSLLKEYLMEYAELFEKLKIEQNDFLQQAEKNFQQERKLLQDKLDKFSFKQQQMNEQIISLNDNIANITVLENLCKAERKIDIDLD